MYLNKKKGAVMNNMQLYQNKGAVMKNIMHLYQNKGAVMKNHAPISE
jgi:hypothetical protein